MTSYIQPASSRLLVLLFRIKDLSLPLLNLMLGSINIMQCWGCIYILKEMDIQIEANIIFSIVLCQNVEFFKSKTTFEMIMLKRIFWNVLKKKKTDYNKQKRKPRLVIMVNLWRKINLLPFTDKVTLCLLWSQLLTQSQKQDFRIQIQGQNVKKKSACMSMLKMALFFKLVYI